MQMQPFIDSTLSKAPAVSDDEARRTSLAQFLRVRREHLQPEDVGLSSSSRRRTPGLRREEVAVLANVGVTWYTWLEQGRDIGVSTMVVDAIGHALRLEGGDLEYLYVLTGKQLPVRLSAASEVKASLERVLGGFTESPAYAVDRYWNVLATNEIAEYVFGISVGSNCLQDFFTKPDIAAHYPHRELAGRMMVAQFRRQAAMYNEDSTFSLLVEDIASQSPEFRTYWDAYLVGGEPHVDIVYDHAQLGRLTLESTVLNPVGGDDVRVLLYTPRLNSGTAEALQRID